MNILFIGAHHDDLEVSMGASAKRWVAEGHYLSSAILTDSTWKGADGSLYRRADEVERYCRKAAGVLGYTPFNLRYCSGLELTYSDDKVADLLRLIGEHEIDTVIALTPADGHRDHRVASEIAMTAARRVPRLLLARVGCSCWPNYSFRPRYFVDITNHFAAKQEALRCYEDEYDRKGPELETFIQSMAKLYGLEAGCQLAEGFEVVRYVY